MVNIRTQYGHRRSLCWAPSCGVTACAIPQPEVLRDRTGPLGTPTNHVYDVVRKHGMCQVVTTVMGERTVTQAKNHARLRPWGDESAPRDQPGVSKGLDSWSLPPPSGLPNRDDRKGDSWDAGNVAKVGADASGPAVMLGAGVSTICQALIASTG